MFAIQSSQSWRERERQKLGVAIGLWDDYAVDDDDDILLH